MARADSIHKLTLTAARQIRASLKARGISIPDVDGGHDSDHALRGLQELQVIAQGLDQADATDTARTSSVGTTSDSAGTASGVRTDGPVDGSVLRSSAATGDAGTSGPGKK